MFAKIKQLESRVRELIKYVPENQKEQYLYSIDSLKNKINECDDADIATFVINTVADISKTLKNNNEGIRVLNEAVNFMDEKEYIRGELKLKRTLKNIFEDYLEQKFNPDKVVEKDKNSKNAAQCIENVLPETYTSLLDLECIDNFPSSDSRLERVLIRDLIKKVKILTALSQKLTDASINIDIPVMKSRGDYSSFETEAKSSYNKKLSGEEIEKTDFFYDVDLPPQSKKNAEIFNVPDPFQHFKPKVDSRFEAFLKNSLVKKVKSDETTLTCNINKTTDSLSTGTIRIKTKGLTHLAQHIINSSIYIKESESDESAQEGFNKTLESFVNSSVFEEFNNLLRILENHIGKKSEGIIGKFNQEIEKMALQYNVRIELVKKDVEELESIGIRLDSILMNNKSNTDSADLRHYMIKSRKQLSDLKTIIKSKVKQLSEQEKAIILNADVFNRSYGQLSNVYEFIIEYQEADAREIKGALAVENIFYNIQVYQLEDLLKNLNLYIRTVAEEGLNSEMKQSAEELKQFMKDNSLDYLSDSDLNAVTAPHNYEVIRKLNPSILPLNKEIYFSRGVESTRILLQDNVISINFMEIVKLRFLDFTELLSSLDESLPRQFAEKSDFTNIDGFKKELDEWYKINESALNNAGIKQEKFEELQKVKKGADYLQDFIRKDRQIMKIVSSLKPLNQLLL